MTDLIALAFVIFLLVRLGWSAVWWILGFVAVLIVVRILVAMTEKGNGTTAGQSPERPRTRIDHLHYLSDDDYECSICGTRFSSDLDRCPHCGVIFNDTEVDEEEFEEELEEEMDMDDWDE